MTNPYQPEPKNGCVAMLIGCLSLILVVVMLTALILYP